MLNLSVRLVVPLMLKLCLDSSEPGIIEFAVVLVYENLRVDWLLPPSRAIVFVNVEPVSKKLLTLSGWAE